MRYIQVAPGSRRKHPRTSVNASVYGFRAFSQNSRVFADCFPFRVGNFVRFNGFFTSVTRESGGDIPVHERSRLFTEWLCHGIKSSLKDFVIIFSHFPCLLRLWRPNNCNLLRLCHPNGIGWARSRFLRYCFWLVRFCRLLWAAL